ncbi:SAST synthase, partial [Pycnonotus jocosus]|nr:SAST synthase [Pycnonotus jocosus]
RLICFPWAGGGTSQLARWGKLFNDSIKVFCIRLPGRESCLEEPFAKDIASVLNEVTSVFLKGLKEKPFAIFAHSFGTYRSSAIALHLKEKYGLEPVHLFMSAAHAPNSAGHLALKNAALPDDSNYFLTCMEIIGGNYEIPHNDDIRKNVVVTSRADTRVFQTFLFEKTEMNIPFSCDVTYFYGSNDKIYDAQGTLLLVRTNVEMLPGDHFYLLKPSNESLLVKHITRCIENAGL